MQMLGSFAEFEREMIRERTRAGLHEARAQGRVPGRKPKITAEQKKEIVEAVSSGRKTPAEIARLLNIHRATVSRIVSQARVGSEPPQILSVGFWEDFAMTPRSAGAASGRTSPTRTARAAPCFWTRCRSPSTAASSFALPRPNREATVHSLTHDPLANFDSGPPPGTPCKATASSGCARCQAKAWTSSSPTPPYITRYRERGGRSVAGDDNARAAKGLGREYLASSWTALIARPLPAAC